MKRDPEALERATYDLVIVGGGIYGVCAAWEAARRGMTVGLLDKGDFGAATSANSLRILHGGLRYLQHLDWRRMRESIHERSLLMRLAPHLARPLAFAMPTYGAGARSRAALAVALRLNDWVSIDRNRGLPAASRIPSGRTVSRGEMLRLCPGLLEDRLTGGALWYDGQVERSERLLLGLLEAATEAGAVVANYLEATRLLLADGRVEGVAAQDRLSGRSLDIRARFVLNAAGPWLDLLAGSASHGPKRFHPSKGMNLVTRQLFSGHAVGIPGAAGFRDADAIVQAGTRLFFVVPWHQYSLIGTKHLPFEGPPDECDVQEQEIRDFLAEVNRAYPPAALRREDVIAVQFGVLPRDMRASAADGVQTAKHFSLIDHEREDGIRGMVSIIGEKWTTARRGAADTVEMIASRQGRRPAAAPEPAIPPCSRFGAWAEFRAQAAETRPAAVDDAAFLQVLDAYGAGYRQILEEIDRDPALGGRVDSASPVILAEIVHAVRREMAQRLEDVVLRRTALHLTPGLGRDALTRCAALMSAPLGWDGRRIDQEVESATASLTKYWRSGHGQ